MHGWRLLLPSFQSYVKLRQKEENWLRRFLNCIRWSICYLLTILDECRKECREHKCLPPLIQPAAWTASTVENTILPLNDSVVPVLTWNYSLPWFVFKLHICVSVKEEITFCEYTMCNSHVQFSEPGARRLCLLEMEIKLPNSLRRHWTGIIWILILACKSAWSWHFHCQKGKGVCVIFLYILLLLPYFMPLLGEKKSRNLTLECRCPEAMGKNVNLSVPLVCPGNYQDHFLLTVNKRPMVTSVPGEHVVSLWSFFKWTFIVTCNRVASAIAIHHGCICLIAWGICISSLKIYSHHHVEGEDLWCPLLFEKDTLLQRVFST